MIPILYESTEKAFTSNGIGRLSDAISCKVKEERNGIFELEMVYPITGIHYLELNEDRLILAKPNDTSRDQIFRIYSIEKPINGKVKVLAEHISYILNAMVLKPFTASSCTEAIAKIPQNFVTGSSEFTFDTDKQVTGNFVLEEPASVRSVLGGTKGSLLDVYGKADYEFDNFTVHMWQNRGSDNGVTIRYGKNLTDLTSTTDDQETYAGVVPFWRGTPEGSEDEVLVTLPGYVVWSSHQWDFAHPRITIYDASSDFDDEPSAEALRQIAQSYLTANEGWNKKTELEVDFVALWQTEEYKDIAAAERVSLCDMVTVVYPKLGVSEKLKVTKTDYNVLLERYNSITLGESRTNLITEVASVDEKFRNFQVTTKTSMQLAIEHATNLITGGAGGHVVIGTDADGKPNEIFIMNTDNTETATQILRINMNGIGFANNIDGPYYSAWTLDGHFNADFIHSGTINGNLIKAGIIESEKHPGTYWNLESGEFHLSTGDAQQIAQYVDSSGVLLAMPYTLNGNIVNFKAELRVGDDITTLDHPPGAFQWFKKEDYKITYLDAGYEFQFDLADFVYGGSIILRYDKTFDYGLLLDSDGNYLLEDGGDRLVIVDGDQNADYLYAETDFTNGTRTAELEITANGILSRLNHFNGTNKTFESTFNQTAEEISSSVTAVNNKLENNYPTTTVTKSLIKQTAESIALSVTQKAHSGSQKAEASIIVSIKDADGTEHKTKIGTIDLDGLVTFTNLSTVNSRTTINGGNIHGGTLTLGGASNGNGRISMLNANSVEIGFWDNGGLRIQKADMSIRTTITEGVWTVYRNTGSSSSPTWSGIGSNGNYKLRIDSTDFNVYGINALTGAAGLALCIDGTPYYAMNTSDAKGGGFDLSGYGFRHYFKGDIYCTNVFKTSNGYGIAGDEEYIGDRDQAVVWTGANFKVDGTGSTDGWLWTTGNLQVDGTGYSNGGFYGSDRRLKKDISDLEVSKSKEVIMSLRPVSYRYISDSKMLRHGFIAQEVQEASDWSPVVENPINHMLSLEYYDYIADLVKVVQDQEKRIKDLEAVKESSNG